MIARSAVPSFGYSIFEINCFEKTSFVTHCWPFFLFYTGKQCLGVRNVPRTVVKLLQKIESYAAFLGRCRNTRLLMQNRQKLNS